MYSKSNFVHCVYHLTMNGRFKTSVLILSLTKLMWPPLIDWNNCLFAGFWCGTLEEFVGPNWDEITLNDALQAYAISDIWWEICHEKVGLRWTERFWTDTCKIILCCPLLAILLRKLNIIVVHIFLQRYFWSWKKWLKAWESFYFSVSH